MIKDFFRYSRNYFKHKLFRLIIYGFIAFLVLTFLKIKKVNASTIDNATATTYFTTQYCDLDSSNVFQCFNGPSFRFPYQVNNSGNDYTFYPFLLNTDDYYVLFKNMIIKYDFSEPITIDSTHRSIYTMFNGTSYVSTSINDGFQINQNWLKTDVIVNDGTDNRYRTPINYSFKPYYCEYLDSNDLTHSCGVILEHNNSTTNNFWFVYDIPLNSVVKSIKVYIGDYNYYTSYNRKMLVGGSSLYVPNNNNITYFEWVSGRSNFQTYRVNYDTYRSRSNSHGSSSTPSSDDNIGLYWLYKGYSLRAPSFNVPTLTTELNYNSNTYTNNAYKFYFDSYSQDLIDSISGTTNRVDEELDGASDENYRDTWLEDLYGDFNQGYARNFSTLFSNLFAYPISKFNEQKDIDLVRTNLQNNVILNNLLCTRNSGLDNLTGDYNPYEIHLWGNYTFKLPCPHTDIYPLLKSGNYAFYPNVFKGANLQQGVVFSFSDIWLTLQHGLLVYFLFVNILNMFKYMVDYHKHEVEVLEL